MPDLGFQSSLGTARWGWGPGLATWKTVGEQRVGRGRGGGNRRDAAQAGRRDLVGGDPAGALAGYRVPASLRWAPRAACGAVSPAGTGPRERGCGAAEPSGRPSAQSLERRLARAPSRQGRGRPGRGPCALTAGRYARLSVGVSVRRAVGASRARREAGRRLGGAGLSRLSEGGRLLRLRGGVSTGLGWWVGRLVLLPPGQGVQNEPRDGWAARSPSTWTPYLHPLPPPSSRFRTVAFIWGTLSQPPQLA